MRHRRGTGQRQAGNHRQNGGKGHSGDKAEEGTAANGIGQMHRRHIVAANQRASGIFKRRVSSHQQNGAEADNKSEEVEVTHKAGSPEYAFTRFASIADGKETHQDMRQACGTKHQAKAQRQRRDRIFHQPARAHDRRAFGMHRHRLGEQVIEAEAHRFHHHNGHK